MFKIHRVLTKPEVDEETGFTTLEVLVETEDSFEEQNIYFEKEQEAEDFQRDFMSYSLRTIKPLDLDNEEEVNSFWPTHLRQR